MILCGVINEVYYVGQKVVWFMGINNVDNLFCVCYVLSTIVFKDMLGVVVSICLYVDWLETDLFVFIGLDVFNN